MKFAFWRNGSPTQQRVTEIRPIVQQVLDRFELVRPEMTYVELERKVAGTFFDKSGQMGSIQIHLRASGSYLSANGYTLALTPDEHLAFEHAIVCHREQRTHSTECKAVHAIAAALDKINDA